MGAIPWAKMLSHSNLGRREAAPQVAQSERSRPPYGSRREAARGGLRRASVKRGSSPSGESRSKA
eukprot:2078212-Alexandrium_andersonii.AAC.1